MKVLVLGTIALALIGSTAITAAQPTFVLTPVDCMARDGDHTGFCDSGPQFGSRFAPPVRQDEFRGLFDGGRNDGAYQQSLERDRVRQQ